MVAYRPLRDLSDFVPEGLDDRSQAIYCLEHVQLRIRPVGHGLILTHGCLLAVIVARQSDPITPYPTGRIPFCSLPGNKLPGYFHTVPPGRAASFTVFQAIPRTRCYLALSHLRLSFCLLDAPGT